jgi:hypothetical protein
MIKQTNAITGWIVFDTARGMTVGNDPYLFMNTIEQENIYGALDFIATTSVGFNLTSSIIETNRNGGTYIFLAIA